MRTFRSIKIKGIEGVTQLNIHYCSHLERSQEKFILSISVQRDQALEDSTSKWKGIERLVGATNLMLITVYISSPGKACHEETLPPKIILSPP